MPTASQEEPPPPHELGASGSKRDRDDLVGARRGAAGTGAPKPWYKSIGPGLVTGAADDDPSGIGTYSQCGASFGYGQLWLVPFFAFR